MSKALQEKLPEGLAAPGNKKHRRLGGRALSAYLASVETTARYYAEIDETLALQNWQDFLEIKCEQSAARKAGGGPCGFQQ